MKKYVSFVVAIMLIITSVFLCPMDLNAEEGAETEIIAFDRLFIGVGDAYTFDIQLEVDYYYITTVNSNIVSVTIANGVYTIHGVSSGTTSILVNYYINGVFDCKLCTIDVFENYANTLQNAYGAESFYLYAAPGNALVHGNISGMIPQVSTWQASYNLHPYWQITPAGNGYYYIGLYAMNVFLKYDNNQLKLHSTLSEGIQKWRILINHEGYYVFVPVTVEHTNKALSTTGTSIYVGDYYSGTNAKYWRIVPKTFYIDNYYDSSFNLGGSVIITANEFVRDYAFWGTGFSIDYSDSITYRTDFLADQCPYGNSAPCGNNCGVECDGDHHKSYVEILSDFGSKTIRNDNHISFLWADRNPSVYCEYETVEIGGIAYPSFAYGAQLQYYYGIEGYEDILLRVNQPFACSYTISKATTSMNNSKIEAVSAIVFAHEIAHTLFMYEAYDVTPNHNEQSGVSCIMNRVNLYSVEDQYERILDSEDAFCSTCYEHLCEKAGDFIYIYGYEYLNGEIIPVEGE